jgi:hypothetical protein
VNETEPLTLGALVPARGTGGRSANGLTPGSGGSLPSRPACKRSIVACPEDRVADAADPDGGDAPPDAPARLRARCSISIVACPFPPEVLPGCPNGIVPFANGSIAPRNGFAPLANGSIAGSAIATTPCLHGSRGRSGPVGRLDWLDFEGDCGVDVRHHRSDNVVPGSRSASCNESC